MNETTNTAPGWTGRADYAERREARIERLQNRAERHEEAAQAAFGRAHAAIDGIPLGQPNIKGCLTGAYNRHDAAMRTSISESDKEDYARSKAQAAMNNHAISSDDPEALTRLREKLARLERLQEQMKAANAAIRMKDTAKGDARLAELGYGPARHCETAQARFRRTRRLSFLRAHEQRRDDQEREGAHCAAGGESRRPCAGGMDI